MKDCKPVHTPMVSKSLDEATSEEVDQTHYQDIIGCLLYLAGRTRPDICAAVNILSRYAANPRLSHLVAAKRVLRYLHGTKTLCLRIQPRGTTLTAYADADWGSDKTARKSTNGVLMQLGRSTVAWKTRKQSVIALSTTEAEFVAASEACKLVIWCRELLAELSAANNSPKVLFQDNQGALKWEEDGIRSNAKHVAIRGNFVKKQIEAGHLAVKYYSTTQMRADILTRALDRTAFVHCRGKVGLVSSSNK